LMGAMHGRHWLKYQPMNSELIWIYDGWRVFGANSGWENEPHQVAYLSLAHFIQCVSPQTILGGGDEICSTWWPRLGIWACHVPGGPQDLPSSDSWWVITIPK
jgi:hypothetical protein